MNKDTFKRVLPTFVFILFLVLIITSSLFDLEQKRKMRQKRIQMEAEIAQKKIYLTGKFFPEQKEDFVLIPPEYLIEIIQQSKTYLRKEAFEAYLQMQEFALKDNIELKIASATRNFDYQRELWGNKWTGIKTVNGNDLSKSIPNGQERFNKILEYTAVPGTSRHHWGTDIDINGANLTYFKSQKGQKEYEWLIKNAYRFGFCQTYDLKGSNRPIGYNEEKWHWSYMPLSRTLIQEYKNLITNENISGFLGDKYVAGQDLINNYVLAINPDCI